MKGLYEFLSSDNMVAYWLEKHVNDQPLLGETLFPNRKQIGIQLDWIKGANDQPVGLRLSAFDSKTIRRDREGFEQYREKMPFFKESVYIDEELRQQLNIYMANNRNAMAEQILAKIFDGQVKLITSAYITVERMRMEALTTGVISLGSNGQAYSYDFGIPADQMQTVTKSWTDPTADVLADVTAIVDGMKAKGINIKRAVCNNSVATALRTNNAIKNSIYVLAGGSIPSITTERVLNYIYEETGISFYVYDNVWVDENKQAHKYIPDNTVVFLPEGTLGYTNFGTTPEESDLMNSISDSSVSLVNNAIAVTNHIELDPVLVETKVSMICLPSFERADEVVILDTEATTSAG
jgi:hypothetical protein